MKKFIGIFFLLYSSWVIAIPDFQAIKDSKQRQRTFFNYLLPYARSVNQSILQDRKKILTLQTYWQQNHYLSSADKNWLQQTAKSYHLKSFTIEKSNEWQKLIERVDIVPISLVLAQAANESAWGASRFAKQANNFFGQWCFKSGCGLVPKQRPKGSHYEVKKFSSPFAAIQQYMINLNTNNSYQLLRKLRKTLRKQHKTIAGYSLAKGLIHYSQRKEQYVRSIRLIIKRNKLSQYDVACDSE